jgi:hypothetical protein
VRIEPKAFVTAEPVFAFRGIKWRYLENTSMTVRI